MYEREELIFKKPRYKLHNIDTSPRDDGYCFAIEIFDKTKKEISVILFQATHGWEWSEEKDRIKILRPVSEKKSKDKNKRKRKKKSST